jgi:carbamoyl-phosphate synthase small subunit
MNNKAILYLEDGTIFWGSAFGSLNECVGEVVFNTGMTGYQEILTDPSYKGQIVTLTYPEIGNYGTNFEDIESEKIYLEGLIVREYFEFYSNYRAKASLGEFLNKNRKIGLFGIDTRKLTKILREKGTLIGVISTDNFDVPYLQQRVQGFGSMVGKNLVKEIGTRDITNNLPLSLSKGETERGFNRDSVNKKVAILDYGCKLNIIRKIAGRGGEVKVFDLNSNIDEIKNYNPDGILVSNGPGDPAAVHQAIDLLKKLKSLYPIFGICLGHQLLGLASGAKTLKLKYGHHGLNHPVKRLSDGKIEITSQNHNFAIDPDTIDSNEIEITHISLNDFTVEGIRYRNLPIFSVQYHPEAAPGPHDADYLFDEFFKIMNKM